MSLVPRGPQEVTKLPPSSVALFVSSNSPVLCRMCSSVYPHCETCAHAAASLRASDTAKRQWKYTMENDEKFNYENQEQHKGCDSGERRMWGWMRRERGRALMVGGLLLKG